MSKYQEPTDPYGHLIFGIGDEDDFFCFDYAELPDGQMVLHAVINSETGSFIMDAETPTICTKADAPDVALGLVDQGADWCGENEVEHDSEGWNQDIYYFYRAVKAYCEGAPSPERLIENYSPEVSR